MKMLMLSLLVLSAVSCAHKLNPQYGQSPNPDAAHRTGFGYELAGGRGR